MNLYVVDTSLQRTLVSAIERFHCITNAGATAVANIPNTTTTRMTNRGHIFKINEFTKTTESL